MKKLFFLLFFAALMLPAQEIEEMQEGFFYAENSKNFFRVDIKKPFDYYKVSGCGANDSFVRAQYEGGDAAFTRELFRYISAYVDKEIYVVNGPFFLHLDIDKTGRIRNIGVSPKVKNSELFLRDLKYATRKIKKEWIPSKCNGVPVDSKLRIRLNFETESVAI